MMRDFPEELFPEDFPEADRLAVRFLYAIGVDDAEAHFHALRDAATRAISNVPPRDDAPPTPPNAPPQPA